MKRICTLLVAGLILNSFQLEAGNSPVSVVEISPQPRINCDLEALGLLRSAFDTKSAMRRISPQKLHRLAANLTELMKDQARELVQATLTIERGGRSQVPTRIKFLGGGFHRKSTSSELDPVWNELELELKFEIITKHPGSKNGVSTFMRVFVDLDRLTFVIR